MKTPDSKLRLINQIDIKSTLQHLTPYLNSHDSDKPIHERLAKARPVLVFLIEAVGKQIRSGIPGLSYYGAVSYLSKSLGRSYSTISRHLRRLEEVGLIQKHPAVASFKNRKSKTACLRIIICPDIIKFSQVTVEENQISKAKNLSTKTVENNMDKSVEKLSSKFKMSK